MTERSFVMVKPDGVAAGLTGEIITRIERRGLTILALRKGSMPAELKHKGAKVSEGQLLGRAGNTGNSTNPHTHIYLDVKDEQGKVVNWQLEGYPPVALHRIGWRQNVTMKVGDTITVSGWRARDGGSWGHSREITLPSGEKMMFGPPAGTGDGGGNPAVDVR